SSPRPSRSRSTRARGASGGRAPFPWRTDQGLHAQFRIPVPRYPPGVLAAGDTLDNFLDHFPSVKREQATAVLELAAKEPLPACVYSPAILPTETSTINKT